MSTPFETSCICLSLSLTPCTQTLLRSLYEYLEHSASTQRANSWVGVRTYMPGPFLCSLASG